MRTPHLVAWQGGPKALELSGVTVEKRLDVALGTLSRVSGKTKSYLRSHLEKVDNHNWSRDPFSLGAYSYISVGGAEQLRICDNIENTLFLAGEAMARGAARGTVHGALESGAETAQRALKVLRQLK